MENKNKAELQEIAGTLGIKFNSKTTKEELIKAINDAGKDQAPTESENKENTAAAPNPMDTKQTNKDNIVSETITFDNKKDVVSGSFEVTERSGVQYRDDNGAVRYAQFGKIITSKNIKKGAYGLKTITKRIAAAPGSAE